MLKYLQLPFVFDANRLREEVQALSMPHWKAHYNTRHYEGDWSIIPLRAIGGNADNTFSIHTEGTTAQYADTPLLDACPYVRELLDGFHCPKTSVRLMKLDKGAVIKEHCDYDMHFEAGEARFHIPVQTNDRVFFYIEEERVLMQEGECWYLNLTLPHQVRNEGAADRIHLVVDVLVNDWIKELFARPGLYKKEIAGLPTPRHTAAELEQIIRELERNGTPAAVQLAASMRQQPDTTI
jgi:Aspartyl/Asparaginyl beta-hydroxylase